jgi:hypothetical protein
MPAEQRANFMQHFNQETFPDLSTLGSAGKPGQSYVDTMNPSQDYERR